MTTYDGAVATTYTSNANGVKMVPGKLIADFRLPTMQTIDRADI